MIILIKNSKTLTAKPSRSPDFICNAGGVICAAVEYHGGNERSAFEDIEAKINRNTQEVLAAAAEAGIMPRQAAVSMARKRVF